MRSRAGNGWQSNTTFARLDPLARMKASNVVAFTLFLPTFFEGPVGLICSESTIDDRTAKTVDNETLKMPFHVTS